MELNCFCLINCIDLFYFSKSETTIRVVRVKLNNGERVVGVRYPEVLVRQVEKVLSEQNRFLQTQLVITVYMILY